jgi:hypothetical protein
MTATLRPVARMASLMMNEEKVPFCFRIYRRARKKDKFKFEPGLMRFGEDRLEPRL